MNKYKILNSIIFIIWALIGISIIFLPQLYKLSGKPFEIESNKKFVYMYAIGSSIVTWIRYRIAKKYKK